MMLHWISDSLNIQWLGRVQAVGICEWSKVESSGVQVMVTSGKDGKQDLVGQSRENKKLSIPNKRVGKLVIG